MEPVLHRYSLTYSVTQFDSEEETRHASKSTTALAAIFFICSVGQRYVTNVTYTLSSVVGGPPEGLRRCYNNTSVKRDVLLRDGDVDVAGTGGQIDQQVVQGSPPRAR